MPRYAIPHVHPRGTEQPTSPLFQRRLEAAVRAVPENPREGHAPPEKRPMPRNKVAAAFLHCLRLSGPDIAKVAGKITGKAVGYGLLRVWLTEEPFRALVAVARMQILEDLKKAYSNCSQDREAFNGLRRELLVFSEVIITDAIIHIKKIADATAEHTEARNTHELNWVELYIDWYESRGERYRQEMKRAFKKAMPLKRLVEKMREIFATAREEQNWDLARKVFDEVVDLASAFAEKADAKTQHRHRGSKNRRPV